MSPHPGRSGPPAISGAVHVESSVDSDGMRGVPVTVSFGVGKVVLSVVGGAVHL